MADLGRIVAGFIGGASGTALEFIKANEEDKRELRKAELLQRLRLQTSKELADYQQKLDQSELDKDLTTVEGNEVVMRDKAGNIIRRRAQTDREKELESFTRESRSLDLEGARTKIASDRADIGLKGAQAQYYRNGGSGGSAGGAASLSSNEIKGRFKEEIAYKAKDAITYARSAGVPDTEINRVIDTIFVRESQKPEGQRDLSSAAQQVSNAVSLIAQGMESDPITKETSFSRDKYDAAKNTFRKTRGLDSR